MERAVLFLMFSDDTVDLSSTLLFCLRKLRFCCTREGAGIAARSISASGANGIARSLAETRSAS